MKNKIISVAIIGKTNAGKSTLINSIIGEKISIENKKTNTTLESIIGIINIQNTQIIFYDTPGINYLKISGASKKKIKTEIWEALYHVDLVLFLIDVNKFDHHSIIKDIDKISEIKKPITIIFNKVDLIKKEKILLYIKNLNQKTLIHDFFIISAKYKKGLNMIIKYLVNKANFGKWKFEIKDISNKDDIFITNECTRNALLKFLHKEIPYNIIVKNHQFKVINKNNIKIRQSIEISNIRYKPIILGKKGETIKRIRISSQKDIEEILHAKIHLYLDVVQVNAK